MCSIAEAVLLTIPPSYVAHLEQQGQRSGRVLARLKHNIDNPLAAILTLNTIANTAGATGVGAQAAVVFGSKSVGIVSAVLTFLILVCSEIIPKTLGSVYWRKLVGPVANGVQALTWILYPFVILARLLTRLIAKRAESSPFRREEFSALAQLGAQHGHLSPKEYRIVGNLLRFRSYTVHDIMTPRTVVMAFQEDTTANDALAGDTDIPYTRLPIYKDDADTITGFVLKTDLLVKQASGDNPPLRELKRELKVLPETTSLLNAFEFLVDQREHIALAVDEYGGVAGIITLEDVVETLLGLEIVDEADVTVDMQALARARWRKHAERHGIDVEQ